MFGLTMNARRLAALAGIAGLAATALVAGVVAPASAASENVASEAEFRAAIATLSGDSGGPHTIEITDSFTWTDAGEVGAPVYSGDQTLTINGNGHTITYGATAHPSALLGHGSSAELTVNSLTVTGFDDSGVLWVASSADVFVNDSAFSDNAGSLGTSGGVIAADDSVVTIEGSTFTSNQANNGGAVDAAQIVVIDSEFVSNTASDDGGALFSYSGTVGVSGSTFNDNEAGDDGGAIATGSGDVTVSASTFDGNVADDEGGGIFVDNGDVSVSDSTFENSWAGDDGGAIDAEDGTVTVEQNSVFNNNIAVDRGGAFASDFAEVSDSSFDGNRAEGNGDDGGAIRVQNGVTVSNSTFTDNWADLDGGAIYSSEDMEVVDSVFTGNESGDEGGALYADTYVSIEDSRFSDNHSQAHGGAIYVDGDSVGELQPLNIEGQNEPLLEPSASLVVTDSVFEDNTAASSGGAVYTGYDADYIGSTFTSNLAYGNGGAVYSWDGDVTVSSSTFVANEAALEDGEEPSDRGQGGAIYVDYYGIDIETSTFVDNIASQGGAAYAGGRGDVDNSTFEGNTAVFDGGALYSGDEVTVLHATFANNAADGDGAHVWGNNDFYSEASVYTNAISSDGCSINAVITDGFNFDDDGSCSESVAETDGDFGFGADPQLGAVADNGGPTQTMLPAAGSPLIDAIAVADCYGGDDQRGVERPAGDGCDVGAVEVLEDLTFTIGIDGGRTIEGTVSNATCVQDVDWAQTSNYSTPPAGLSVPFGVSEFSFCVPADGWTVDIDLDLPSPVNSLWKVSGADWIQIDGAAFDGTVVSYSVTDGGELDEDGTADSFIIDPVAPGILSTFTG